MAAQRDGRTDKSEKLTLAQAVNHGLAQEMERDPNVLVMGEDVGVDGGVFRVTEGLMEKFGPDRVMDTPLAESAIVGAAIGLAVAGFRPVCEIQFTGFVYPALNQLFAHVARYRNRSRGRYPLPMVIRMPYGGGIHPPEHHSESYEALFAHTPGLKVVIPSTPSDAKGLITAAIRDDDPVIFMEPKRIYRAFREDVSSLEYTVPIGEAKIVSEGKDVTIIAYGAMVRVALEAQEALSRQNVLAEVIDLRTINPMDIKTVLGSAEKTGRVVVVHEAPRNAGLGAEIAALIQERAMLSLLAPIQRVCGFDSVFPFPRLEEHYLPTKERVMEAVQKTLDF
ncbi:MAG: alpha-ketoacid dehydrogenase subunit beta [Acidobacteria bacterium]|nr:alpha-ketoacid dehydrogenase subunit beta [Acidobacteriota bacterium]